MRRPFIQPLLPLLSLLLVSAPGCGIDEQFDSDETPARATPSEDKADTAADTGPRKRAALRPNVRCFDSYGKFKRAMRKNGLSSKAGESEWHHIVGQHKHNKAKFGEHDLHCTDNIVLLKKTDHTEMNGYYQRIRDRLGDKSFRDWLKPMSFAEQHAYGLKALDEVGVKWDWIK